MARPPRSSSMPVPSDDDSPALTPRRRFPEFRSGEGWREVPLRQLVTPINERVGTANCIPYTVTSGVGLLSQQDKFGRSIAGNSFKNYVRLQKDDFAYNKSATKAFPEGYIARYSGNDRAAVPNSIFTCFRPNAGEVNPVYLEYLFSANLHGRWLRRFLTIGARAHGSLNVNDDDLLALPIPLPGGKSTQVEQQKIAECLTSLDDVIAAQGRKVEALKAHKKGLMQHLFPQEGQTLPRLRFPKFRGGPEWKPATIGSRSSSFSGGTPDTANKDFYGGKIPFIRSAEIAKTCTELSLTEEGLQASAAKMVEEGDVLVALYGANSGDVALSRVHGAINQAILCVRPKGSKAFLYHALTERQPWILATYIQGGQGNLSGEIVKSITLRFPSPEEQEAVAECLIAADRLIEVAESQLDALKTHKTGLLQQLFPSPVRE